MEELWRTQSEPVLPRTTTNLLESRLPKLNRNCLLGGSVEVLEHLRGKGYEFDEGACQGAVEGGHLEALKFLRGLDPPCPWAEGTCAYAAQGGHLEILKWARSEDPPCPWSRRDCRDGAFQSGHQHIIDWIDQQED